MSARRHFASDNAAGVHPRVMEAITKANSGHAVAYGHDEWTRRAEGKFKDVFGENARVFFVFGGTAANVISLAALAKPWEAVLCAESAHIHQNECGAAERFAGVKLLPVTSRDGKILSDDVRRAMPERGDPHHVQAKVISVAQTTESGTVYSRAEMRSLADFAHGIGMFLHVDGARLSNAAAALKTGLKEAADGADILSFGGTKNGLLCGEAIVCFDAALAENLPFIRMQAGHLPSKMRFVAAQFEALLDGELWRDNASRANDMAARLARGLSSVAQVRITRPVESNAVFATFPHSWIGTLRSEYFFHVVDENLGEARLMCAFDTQEEDVDEFVALAKDLAVRAVVDIC